MADWQNKVVDDAEYLIDTSTLLRCEADSLLSVAHVGDDVFAEIFGPEEELSVDEVRAQKATKIRAIVSRLLAIADDLEAPVIDESESPKIGYDADHSIFKR